MAMRNCAIHKYFTIFHLIRKIKNVLVFVDVLRIDHVYVETPLCLYDFRGDE